MADTLEVMLENKTALVEEAGGSGYTGGVPEFTHTNSTRYSPSMSNGTNNGNGQARIAFVAF